MVIRRCVRQSEADHYMVQEWRIGEFGSGAAKVIPGVKGQLVNSGLHVFAREQRLGGAAITVGCSGAQMQPFAASQYMQIDDYATGGLSARSIQHVRRQAAHVICAAVDQGRRRAAGDQYIRRSRCRARRLSPRFDCWPLDVLPKC